VVRAVFLGLFALPLVSGCAVFGPWWSKTAPVDHSVAIHRAAMADFSICATSADPVERLAMAGRLAEASALLQHNTRPRNPDHFYLTDRVSAAAAYCAEAAR
jgi:hypothetical protein